MEGMEFSLCLRNLAHNLPVKQLNFLSKLKRVHIGNSHVPCKDFKEGLILSIVWSSSNVGCWYHTKMHDRDAMTFDQWLCYGFYPLCMCLWTAENYLARENFCSSNFILHEGLKHYSWLVPEMKSVIFFPNSTDTGIFERSLQYTSFSKNVYHQLQLSTL